MKVISQVSIATPAWIGSGHGHIAPGATGMDDFWHTDTRGYWTESHARFATSGATDTFNPACPGRLGTAAFLRILGVRHVPSGIAAQLILTHHH